MKTITYWYRGYSLRVALVIYFGRPPCWVAFYVEKDRNLSFKVISLNFVQSNCKLYSGIRIYSIQVNFKPIPSINYMLKTQVNTFRLLLFTYLSSVTEPMFLCSELSYSVFLLLLQIVGWKIILYCNKTGFELKGD